MLEFFSENFRYIITAHVFFMALGVGGATIADILFFKFLKDRQITEQENGVLKTMSQIIWVAVSGILVTGAMLVAPDLTGYMESERFMAKMSVVAVVILNGVLLNLVISPRMTAIFPGNQTLTASLRRWRKLAFALGAVSIVSWYSAFILGSLRRLTFSYEQLIGTYLILLLVALAGSQISEKLFDRKIN